MADKSNKTPKTQHSHIYEKVGDTTDSFVVLDNPDDRITEQNGDGITLVKNDNPDDVEDKLK